ncbi:MAG: class I SAM-dependent methyltransferase family protein [archaeon]|jgi:tRNA (guanine37-N1)-methyltransferase|nr:class I SAM-dependent methyltransferase family protein [archaeon]
MEFKKVKRPRSLKEALEGKLTESEMKLLGRAFDYLGEIAIIEIPEELHQKEKLIGEALLEVHKALRAVFRKSGKVSGEHRTRNLKRIAGIGTAETTYKENACTYHFDAEKVFFTGRLSTERQRVSDLVGKKEKVLDMFAGVGPYTILIAKEHPGVKLTAIDINKAAIDYLQKNAELNKVSEQITTFVGDASELASELKQKFDRIIMNLPAGCSGHIPAAVKVLKKKGIIHYYFFSGTTEEAKQEAQRVFSDYNYKILNIKKVKPYSPRNFTFVADVELSR